VRAVSALSEWRQCSYMLRLPRFCTRAASGEIDVFSGSPASGTRKTINSDVFTRPISKLL
jgi:hypothetical protein